MVITLFPIVTKRISDSEYNYLADNGDNVSNNNNEDFADKSENGNSGLRHQQANTISIPSDLSFDPPNSGDRFFVQDTDVSATFHEFQMLIKNYKRKLHLETHIHHALVIYHIRLLKPSQHHNDMFNRFGEGQLKLIIDHVYNTFDINKIPLSLKTINKLKYIMKYFQNGKVTRIQVAAQMLMLKGQVPSNHFKFITSVAELLKKLPNSIILEDIKESELCTHYADPILAGLFEEPGNNIFFWWTDESTLKTKKGLSVSKRWSDMCITSLKGSNWKSNCSFGVAEASSKSNNHFYLFKELLRVDIFYKRSIDHGKMKAALDIQVVDAFKNHRKPLSSDQIYLFSKRIRATPTTPVISHILSTESNRKLPCVFT
ncbi:unnamed protein product [Cunninghamella echinulata]